jgi:TetR/AcrR family transcriptional repressor of nem operon
MARNKEYDRENVLDRAVNLLWQNGYKASSVTDIVQATGLNSASMYKEFGDKDGLFEEALERYYQQRLSRILQLLIDEPNFNGIKRYLEYIVTSAASSGYKGCLMVNSLAEKHVISQQASDRVGNFVTRLESLLEEAFRNAQANGDVPTDKNPAVLASFVACFLHGLVLYGRHPNRAEDIRQLYEVMLQAVGG